MAERMTPKHFKEWRERLRYAKGVWQRKGLIGTQEASTMRLLIELNRGNQWENIRGIPGIDEDLLSTVNKIFPTANTIKGEVASRNPKVQVFPRNPESAPMATTVEHLINYDIEELQFKRQSNRALSHHLFAPFGVIRHGFTPREEFESEDGSRMQLYRPAKADRPYIRSWPIWNVLIDPTCETFHVDDGAWWCAYRDILWLEDIKNNPNMAHPDELKNFAGNVSPEWQQMRTAEFDGDDDPDKEKYVEVYTVYESRERTWFQITLDGIDTPLRQPDDWPIPWETLPISIFAANDQLDTPFSLSIMDEAAPIQVEMNRLRTMMDELVFRLRRVIGYDKNKVDQDELAKFEDAAINEMIGVTGIPADVFQMVSSGVFPQELLQYLSVLEADLREVTGVSKMGKAERINVETAHEASFVQQGQDVNTARISDAFEDFNRDVIRLYMQGRRATMDITGPEIVRIVGRRDADGLQQWGTVDPSDLHGDFEFHVVHGSTRKKDREADAQKAALDLQVATGLPDIFKIEYFARKFVESREHPPQDSLTEQALTASAVRTVDTIRRNAQQGEEGPADGGINPAVASALSSNAGAGGLQ